jgi:adenine-specific DNA methylase
MDGYRGEFDIFLSYSNLTGTKIKRIYANNGVECAEFEDGEIMQKDDIDMAKFPKIRDLIWWE